MNDERRHFIGNEADWQRMQQRTETVKKYGLEGVAPHAIRWAAEQEVLEQRTFSLEEIKNVIAQKEGVDPKELSPLDAAIGEDGTILAISFEINPEVSFHYELKARVTYPYSNIKTDKYNAYQEHTRIDRMSMSQISERSGKGADDHYSYVYQDGEWVRQG